MRFWKNRIVAVDGRDQADPGRLDQILAGHPVAVVEAAASRSASPRWARMIRSRTAGSPVAW
ncbi:MAG TPA: hypothetical protein VFJ69_07180 [Actinomycetota bacterium]|nr:hypothetical protein [Actinomycetota bacterium]